MMPEAITGRSGMNANTAAPMLRNAMSAPDVRKPRSSILPRRCWKTFPVRSPSLATPPRALPRPVTATRTAFPPRAKAAAFRVAIWILLPKLRDFPPASSNERPMIFAWRAAVSIFEPQPTRASPRRPNLPIFSAGLNLLISRMLPEVMVEMPRPVAASAIFAGFSMSFLFRRVMRRA